MTYQAILAASIFILIAFGIERVSRYFAIPSVILLVLSGLIAKPVVNYYGFDPLGINTLIPIVGTIGLVLIVLEGALDIFVSKNHLRIMLSTTFTAIGCTILCILIFYPFAVYLLLMTPFQALLLVSPFSVISSAVAISGSSSLNKEDRDFVVYESATSDIVGVLIFFSLRGSDGTLIGILTHLVGGGLLSIILSIISAFGLMLLLLSTDSYIRYIPLLAGLFALYSLGEMLHFSPLIMVLILGMLLNKPTIITRYPFFKRWIPVNSSRTVTEFKSLVVELTFVVRGFFFVLLGYWTNLSDFISIKAWFVAVVALGIVYPMRFIMLRLVINLTRAKKLMWIAPRGLITVLLFFYVKQDIVLPQFLTGAAMLIVLLSSIIMMFSKRNKKTELAP